MVTLKFVIRLSTKVGSREGSVSLRVIHNRMPKTISIGCRLLLDEWDEAKQTIIYPVDDPVRAAQLEEIKKKMKFCSEKMSGIIREMEKVEVYSTKDVIERYHQASDVYQLIGYAATLSAELIESDQKRTAKAYGTACRRLIAFNNQKDLRLTEITSSLIKRFETHLKEEGMLPNTISYYMRNLRAIYNKAFKAGLIPKDEKPFAGVFTGVEETKKRALTTCEVTQIKEVDLKTTHQECDPESRRARNNRNIERARQLFLFSLCAHGMCFVDLCYLKKTQIKNDVLRYYRKKTGKQIEVPMNEEMWRIIKYFEEDVKHSDYLFPLLDDNVIDLRLQYETALHAQNRRLKKITKLAGLEKGITTHVARHSWASILKNEMQPISVISEGLGHSSEKTTRKYLASFDHSILVNAGKVVVTAINRGPDSLSPSI